MSLRTSEPVITLSVQIATPFGEYQTRTLSLTPDGGPQYVITDLKPETYTPAENVNGATITVELLGLHVDPDPFIGTGAGTDEVRPVIGDTLTPPHHHHPDSTVCRGAQCPGPKLAYAYLDMAGETRIVTHRETAHRAAEACQTFVATLPLDGDYRPTDARTREVAQQLLEDTGALPTGRLPLTRVDDVMAVALAAAPGGRDRLLAMLDRDAHADDDAMAHTAGLSGIVPTPFADAISGAAEESPQDDEGSAA